MGILIIFGLLITGSQAFNFGNMFGNGFPFNNGNDLGASIRANVDNMMQNMNHQINEQSRRFQTQFNHQMNDLNQRMAELRAKGDAMGIMTAMMRGVGGTTVVTYNGKSVIVRNRDTIGCTGPITIDRSGAICDGKTYPEDDVCLPGNSYTQMNDLICIFNNNPNVPHNSMIINGQVICDNGQLFTKEGLHEKCGDVYSANYSQSTYIPNLDDPNHIPLPNTNSYLLCRNKNSNICEYSASFYSLANIMANA